MGLVGASNGTRDLTRRFRRLVLTCMPSSLWMRYLRLRFVTRPSRRNNSWSIRYPYFGYCSASCLSRLMTSVSRSGRDRLIPDRLADNGKQPARAALDDVILRLQVVDQALTPRRLHHFVETTSFSIALSSSASASSFLRRAFSASRSLNRLASDTSMPPYLDFQR